MNDHFHFNMSLNQTELLAWFEDLWSTGITIYILKPFQMITLLVWDFCVSFQQSEGELHFDINLRKTIHSHVPDHNLNGYTDFRQMLKQFWKSMKQTTRPIAWKIIPLTTLIL